MTACPGELVLHRDRSAWCSEVREGRACLGVGRPHRAVWTCRLIWGPAHCPRCHDIGPGTPERSASTDTGHDRDGDSAAGPRQIRAMHR